MFVYQSEGLPIKAFMEEEDIYENSLLEQQISHVSELPFLFKYGAMMPDGHPGYGVPIGCVFASEDAIVVNAVGVDIYCGVDSVQTSIKANQLSTEKLKEIMGKVREFIPVGFNKHPSKKLVRPKGELLEELVKGGLWNLPEFVIKDQRVNMLRQLGTLGSGNHFIQFSEDSHGDLNLMVHSGSRKLGHFIGTSYNRMAKELNEKWHTSVPLKWDLAFLPVGEHQADDYLKSMEFAGHYASLNRSIILDKVIDAISTSGFECEKVNEVRTPHNYVELSNHSGKNVWVHRKGAIRARKDELAVIPGDQGSNSYIVKGLGNPDSFNSASHGAGRSMSRTQAKKDLDLKSEIKSMEDRGIIHSVLGEDSLDEAPGSYKDIDTVMANQKSLVKIVNTLKPLAVIKG